MFDVKGTLYEARNQNVEPLFYVEGPSEEVPNLQYAEQIHHIENLESQARELEQALSQYRFLDTEWEGMEKRIQEGTVSDRSNIVLFARFYPTLLTDPDLENAIKTYWMQRFLQVQNTSYASMKAKYGDNMTTSRWESANKIRLQGLFNSLKFVSLPPTEELVRSLFINYLTGADRKVSILQFIDLMRTPKMWAWGQVMTDYDVTLETFWTGQFERWVNSTPGTLTVASFYNFLNTNTGNIVKPYLRSTTNAQKTAVLSAPLPAVRLLQGVTPLEWKAKITKELESIPGLTVNNTNLSTVIEAMQIIQDEFEEIAFAPDSERDVFVKTTREFLNNLRMRRGMEQTVTASLLGSGISVVELTNVDAAQIFGTPAALLDDNYILSKLLTLIQDDAEIALDMNVIGGAYAKITERDGIYEWFLTRNAWIRNTDIARSDIELRILLSRIKLGQMKTALAKISPIIHKPLIYNHAGVHDDLRGEFARLHATIIDKRPNAGGLGGYVFSGPRTYEVEWVKSRDIPDPRLVTNGELSDRTGIQKLIFERTSDKTTVIGYSQKTAIESPILTSVRDYADGQIWCIVKSTDANGLVSIVTSPAALFRTRQFCIRCKNYFSIKNESPGTCEWKNPSNGITYVGKCAESNLEPTPYDAITGVRGSYPIGDRIPYKFVDIYNYVEEKTKAFIQMNPDTFAAQIETARQKLHKEGVTSGVVEADDIAIMENMIRHLQHHPYVNGPINPYIYTPQNLVQNWTTQLFSHKRSASNVFV